MFLYLKIARKDLLLSEHINDSDLEIFLFLHYPSFLQITFICLFGLFFLVTSFTQMSVNLSLVEEGTLNID